MSKNILRLGENLEQDMFSLINAPLQAGREPLQKVNSNSVIWTCRVCLSERMIKFSVPF